MGKDRDANSTDRGGTGKAAGVQHDFDQQAGEKRQEQVLDAGREYWKAQVDFFKHLTTLSVVTAGGFTALSRAFIPDPARYTWLFILAFALLGPILITTIGGLLVASNYLATFTAMTAQDIGEEKSLEALSPRNSGMALARLSIGFGYLASVLAFFSALWVNTFGQA